MSQNQNEKKNGGLFVTLIKKQVGLPTGNSSCCGPAPAAGAAEPKTGAGASNAVAGSSCRGPTEEAGTAQSAQSSCCSTASPTRSSCQSTARTIRR